MQDQTGHSDNTQSSINRRKFLATSASAAAAVGFGAPAIVRGRNLNEKLNIAIIGSGGRGGSNLRSVSSENITVLCDVNEQNLLRAGQ